MKDPPFQFEHLHLCDSDMRSIFLTKFKQERVYLMHDMPLQSLNLSDLQSKCLASLCRPQDCSVCLQAFNSGVLIYKLLDQAIEFANSAAVFG